MKKKLTLFFCGLIAYAPQIEIILNKVGSMVHSKGRSGPVIRARVKPRNPRSPDQLTQRGRLTSFTKAWAGLTLPKQQAWIAGADSYVKTSKVNKKYYSTGHKLFVKWNVNAYDNGASTEIDDIFTPTPTAVIEVTAMNFDTTVSPTVAKVTTGATTATNSIVQVWATPQLSAGVFNPGKKFRLIKLLDGGTAAGEQDIKTEYENKFGTLAGFKKVWVRLVTYNNDADKCCVSMGSSELSGTIKG